jgi:phytoene dehydrogenase-like protein
VARRWRTASMAIESGSRSYDAVVIGSGPNGLAAAIAVARAGRSVLVIEGQSTVGGGTRSAELTLPGFVHDVCSAIHPLAKSSPFFSTLPLHEHGLEWIQPPFPLAHPLDDGTAVLMDRSVSLTAHRLGADGDRYRLLMEPLVKDWEHLKSELLRPLRVPRHPLRLARFGLPALMPASTLARMAFRSERARALFAGNAAHSIMPLKQMPSAAFGLLLGVMAHAAGWPLARGGSQSIAAALVSYLQSLGGEVVCGTPVTTLDELPNARAILCDVTPRQLLTIAGHRLPAGFRARLMRYRYGPAAFKMDWALDGPVPWKARECGFAGTVHLGGSLREIEASESAAWDGRIAEKPFVLLAQQSLFDASRAPEGKQTLWGYCHVPNGSTVDMADKIEDQIERFAPGFRDRILAKSVLPPAELHRRNPNLIGGDNNGGAQDLSQMFLRPTAGLYTTPADGLYICSSSTPPGGGVHGMCGYFAAVAALRDCLS